jgi:hypothetical protein
VNDGRISFRTVVGKFVCCSASLATGIALGREGPSAHIGAGLASVIARKLGLSQERVKALVPVGCSAALAAAFNTPIAGVLFSLDPHDLEIKSLGKSLAEPRVRAMACVPDGRVYGISGNEGGMGHLFRYDPLSNELADLGILMSATEAFVDGAPVSEVIVKGSVAETGPMIEQVGEVSVVPMPSTPSTAGSATGLRMSRSNREQTNCTAACLTI